MTVWYRFLLQVLSGWRITPPYASFYKRNTFNVDLMQIQQLLCLQKSTLNVFFNFFCSRGWSEGACFLHLLREDHRSSLKVENFLPKGVSFYPSISPFTMKAYEGYTCKSPLLTNGKEGKSLLITRRRKKFVWDGYKLPCFFSIYYEGICRTCL